MTGPESEAVIPVLGTDVRISSDNIDATAYVARAAEIREDLVSALKEVRDSLKLREAIDAALDDPNVQPLLLTVIRALRMAGAA